MDLDSHASANKTHTSANNHATMPAHVVLCCTVRQPRSAAASDSGAELSDDGVGSRREQDQPPPTRLEDTSCRVMGAAVRAWWDTVATPSASVAI